jgi:orotidine-5'-phosphate decarboxylase
MDPQSPATSRKTSGFAHKLTTAQQVNDSWVCVGLDPVMERLPKAVATSVDPLLTFGRAIVEATTDLVCAYKPNLAFWLAEGPNGLAQLQQLITGIPDHIPVILDAKFNDIGHTARAYARAAFRTLAADAVTANPYLGLDAIRPFLADETHGVFLLVRTSNRSAPDLQDQCVENRPLYERVAHLAGLWNRECPGLCGLVVGATYPEELAGLRRICPDLPFLIPGIGAQGGNLETAVAYGSTTDHIGPVINSSRSIIYASQGPDFATAARDATVNMREQINQLREQTR